MVRLDFEPRPGGLVARVTLDNPRKLNIFTRDAMTALAQAMQEAGRAPSDSVRSVLDLLRELRERQAQAEAQTQPADHARALAFAEAAIALAQELGAWPPSPELRFARLEGKIAMRKILNDPRLAHPPGPRA